MNSVISPDLISQRLGFGCGRLKGGIDKPKSLSLVHAALEMGIRHFDTAPMYGLGASEPVLGEALKGRIEAVTVFTKAGLPRPAAPTLMQTARRLVKPLANRIPGLRQALLKGMAARAAPTNFDPAFIAQSFTTSLRLLQRDRVDGLLLHEATPSDDLRPLSSLLDGYVDSGLLGAYGSSTGEPFSYLVSFGAIRQYRCPEPSAQKAVEPQHTDILHGAFRFIAPAIAAVISRDKELEEYLASLLPAGTAPASATGALALAYVLGQHDNRVLFSTDQPQRLVSTLSQVRHITATQHWRAATTALHTALTVRAKP